MSGIRNIVVATLKPGWQVVRDAGKNLDQLRELIHQEPHPKKVVLTIMNTSKPLDIPEGNLNDFDQTLKETILKLEKGEE